MKSDVTEKEIDAERKSNASEGNKLIKKKNASHLIRQT